jgi:hypothetical protein
MSKIFLLVIYLTVAHSQHSANSIPTNEYRYQNGALTCFTDSVSKDLQYPCLRIGSINIGDSYKSIVGKYGNPNQSFSQSDGKEIKLYHMRSKEVKLTHLALTVKEDLVIAISIAGAAPRESLPFSSINIGDNSNLIVEILGKPSSTKYVKETGATLWSYAPFPFSFDIVDNKVLSIKIWQP